MTTPAPGRGPAGGGLVAAVRAEWTKLWTVRSTWWLLLAATALMAVACAVSAMSVAASAANGYDVSLTAPQAAAEAMALAQLPVVALAALVVTAEYATGGIAVTLCRTPLRGRVLLAKTAVSCGVALLAGPPLIGIGTAVAATVLPGHGAFAPAEAARTAAALTGYLVLLAAVAVGTATALRGTAGTLVGLVLLLLVAPTVLEMSGVAWLLSAADLLPGTAGQALAAGDGGPYGPGPALAVLAAWAAVSQLAGYAVFWARDA
ncbi:ABC transporter [Marinitenerispora sediminis]|uniref:ABC transporter n=1 Tax=Marinitenerispora sediminis TaxID=1931232 RepID=A0A368TAB5_9ACTN|nr:ABC transporter [Marinitenerispora sediminis]RCV53972.1 ABC transporter [Marinitenerispora sediminis]RCV60477.1 ABC transporter [Marinitenerispora sediminis]RCV61842.1 ABC transporter [Marinitenerispora sediminis]